MRTSPWAWSSVPPHHVGGCVECGCLCLLVPFSDGRVALFDPGLVERRWLRSILPPDLVAIQGFGSSPLAFEGHVCPPAEGRSLPDRPTRAFALRAARRLKGGPR